ncbi:MAG: ABC transporter permease, partial [Shinella sp.]
MTPSPSAILGKLLTGRGSRQGLWLLPLLITLAMVLWLAATTSQFGQWNNLANLVAQGMPLLITAVGQMFVVLVGGLDLSIGSVVSFTTAI